MTSQDTAIVTGAARGIGRAIAQRLSADGFRLVLSDLDQDGLAETLESLTGPATVLAGDITDTTHQDALVEAAGDLLTLVNNAGIFSAGAFLDLSADDFRKMYEVNTIAPFELSKRVVPVMQAAGIGRIVNIASRAYRGGARMTHYAASKGAVVSMTRCMATELGPSNILVNAVAPGVIRTPILDLWDDPNMLPALSKRQALGRIGDPKDIANVVSMLSARQTDFLTGQCIDVEGGIAAPDLKQS